MRICSIRLNRGRGTLPHMGICVCQLTSDIGFVRSKLGLFWHSSIVSLQGGDKLYGNLILNSSAYIIVAYLQNWIIISFPILQLYSPIPVKSPFLSISPYQISPSLATGLLEVNRRIIKVMTFTHMMNVIIMFFILTR